MFLNIARYNELKTKGLITLKKDNDIVRIVRATFDQVTGEPLPLIEEIVDNTSLIATKLILTSQLDGLNQLLTDVETIKTKAK